MAESLDDRSSRAGDPPALTYADPATPHPQQLTPVSRWDVAVIVVKLIGVYFFVVQGLPYLTGSLRMFADGSWRFNTGLTWFYFGVAMGFLAIGLLLFLSAGRIGGWLLPKPQAVTAGSDRASPTTVQEIAFSVVGVYLVVVYAIPGFALQGWSWLADTTGRGGTIQTQLPQFGPYFFEHLVQLVLGVLLFRGSKRLSDYWQRVRQHGSGSGEDAGPL